MSKIVCSIIIPTFNRPDFAIETLQSIKDQTVAEFEALLVDDGSDPENLNLIHNFINQDARFKLLHRTDKSKYCGARRNQGLPHASGEYIMFLDSDDVLEPHTIERRVNSIRKEDLDFCVSPAFLFSDLKGDLGSLTYCSWWNEESQFDLQDFLAGFPVWQISGPLYKNSFLKSVGMFDSAVYSAEDIEFHVRVLLKSPRYKKLGCPDYWYRRNQGGSITSSDGKQRWFFAGVAHLIRKLDQLIAGSSNWPPDLLRGYLWKGAVKASASARHQGVALKECFEILDGCTIRGFKDQLLSWEAKLAISLWFEIFHKVPSMSYLRRRGLTTRP